VRRKGRSGCVRAPRHPRHVWLQVTEKLLPSLELVADTEVVRAVALLRVAAAHLNLGMRQEAHGALVHAGELLEAETEAEPDNVPEFIISEYKYYSAMLNLSIATSAQEVKALENVLLAVRSDHRGFA
jgi:hypothetical protein